MIEENVKNLQRAGFHIYTKKLARHGEKMEPVSIDKQKRTITIIENHPALSDVIQLKDREERVRYCYFESKALGGLDPVRLAKDSVIEINTAYPLFNKGSKSELFRRLHLLLFIANIECHSVEEMYNYLIKHINEEFG